MLNLTMNGDTRKTAYPKPAGYAVLDRLGMAEFQSYQVPDARLVHGIFKNLTGPGALLPHDPGGPGQHLRADRPLCGPGMFRPGNHQKFVIAPVYGNKSPAVTGALDKGDIEITGFKPLSYLPGAAHA